MPVKFLLITAALLILTSPVSAIAGFNITANVIAPVEITREISAQVRTNQPFEVNLHFYDLVDMELFNVSIKETIPSGYKLDMKKIYPEPLYVGSENGATIIYWNIDRLTNRSNLSTGYSLSAPKSAGSYFFRADAFGFDAFNNQYAAVNFTKQEVKKPSLWSSLLEIFGFT